MQNIRCGRPGYRTYRRAYRSPNGLESTFDDLGPLYGGHILAVPRGDPGYLSSDTGWDGDQRYPHTTQCYGFEPKSSPPTLYRGQTAVKVLRPYGEFSTTVRATLVGQQENR